MEPSAAKGNAPDKWGKLLNELDEKLQLGLLDRLRRISSYHLEARVLYLEPSSPEDMAYLEKESVRQQLTVFAAVMGADEIRLEPKA